MFDSLSWGHLLVLAVAALFIFGPERLPTLSRDAARGLARLRRAVVTVRQDIEAPLGDELTELQDLDLRRSHPRTFVRDQLFGDPPATGTSPGQAADLAGAPSAPVPRVGSPTGSRLLPPPFDAEAT